MTRRINAAADSYYVYRPMLDLIGFTEGRTRATATTRRLPMAPVPAVT